VPAEDVWNCGTAVPSEKEMLEVGQCAREDSGKGSARILEFVRPRGIKLAGEYKGRWMYDELYAGNFIQQSGRYFSCWAYTTPR
jgi:hypothetical protein